MYEASTVHLGEGAVAGAFLAPKATSVQVDSSSAGWIVAKGTVKTTSEWHFYHTTNTYNEVLKTDTGVKCKENYYRTAGAKRKLSFKLNYADGEEEEEPLAVGSVELNDGT